VVIIILAGTHRVQDLGISPGAFLRRNWVRWSAMSLTDLPASACSSPHPASRTACRGRQNIGCVTMITDKICMFCAQST
jgi:hypothetical protein